VVFLIIVVISGLACSQDDTSESIPTLDSHSQNDGEEPDTVTDVGQPPVTDGQETDTEEPDTTEPSEVSTDARLDDTQEGLDGADAPTPSDTSVPDTTEPPETVSAGSCASAILLSCDGTVIGNASDFSTGQEVDETACNDFIYPAPEVSYRFDSPGAGEVTFQLQSGEVPLDLLLVPDAEGGGCFLDECLGWDSEKVTVDVVSGQHVWVVVDGYLGAKGPYELSVDCQKLTNTPPTCEAQASVGCGDNLLVPAGEAGASQLLSTYSCTPSAFDGPERVFLFQSDAAKSVTATSGLGGGPIFVLDGDQECSPSTCLAAGDSGEVTFQSKPGGKYFIVVETLDGSEASLSVGIGCEAL